MPPAAQPDPKAAPKDADKTTYQARLVNSRPETNQVIFQVRDGASTRIYTMTLAEGAKVTSGGQPASLSTFDSSAAVTITTEEHGAEEKIVAVADAPADAKNLPMSPTDRDAPATGGKQTMAFPTGDPATSVLSIDTGAPDQVRVGEAFDYQVKVTNISKTLTLENVVDRQAASGKLDVNPGAAPAAPAPAAPMDPKAPASPQSPDQQSGKAGDLRWTIPAMMPGLSVTLQARALAHAEGIVGSCFRVSDEPAL
jgi:hypothetical protein